MPPGGWQQPVQQPAPFGGQLAGWWPRVGATLIDGLIIVVPTFILGIVIFGGVGAAAAGDDEAGFAAFIVGMLLFGLLALVISLLYAPLLMARSGGANGQTWGKQALGIRVVRNNGAPMSFGWAALREAAVKWLGFNFIGGSITFYIAPLLDVLWPLWEDENRALHDLIVGTHVVRA